MLKNKRVYKKGIQYYLCLYLTPFVLNKLGIYLYSVPFLYFQKFKKEKSQQSGEDAGFSR